MKSHFLLLVIFLFISISCEKQNALDIKDINRAFSETINNHLNAVAKQDIDLLKSTIPDSGEFYLILPNGSISKTVKEFVKMHEDWFKETGWTYNTKILKSENGTEMGYALVNAIYREKNRNGKPYFNEMLISYNLKRIDDNWYIVNDHASTLVRSDD